MSKETEFIIDKVLEIIDDQENMIISYMNEYMTQKERDRHGNNIASMLCKSEGIKARINLELIQRNCIK